MGLNGPFNYFRFLSNEFRHMILDEIRRQMDQLISAGFVLEHADGRALTFARIKPIIAYEPLRLLYDGHELLAHHFVDLCTVPRFKMVVTNNCEYVSLLALA